MRKLMLAVISIICLIGCRDKQQQQPLLPDHHQLAATYFGNDSSWYLENIPFFECSDKQIEQVYYYRWKMYKAHIRNTGRGKYVITEFINHVAWDRDPFCTINAASMHHIYEGRWLKDDRYLNGYIDYLLGEGGNNRQYSESIADAAYARFLVNSDIHSLIYHLDSMKAQYERWSDHWDSTKQLYYIAAMPDATEYTIASIDASGGKDGFAGGEAFRPTINSYMYGNANAISRIAYMNGNKDESRIYEAKAAALKQTIQRNLWNDSFQHFVDRLKVNNEYVHYWDFIRGRELAGYAPWYFNLPEDNPTYHQAWKHITDTSRLLGAFGMRTNEPSYEYYFRQYVYFEGQRGSQWNGPSWPYQTCQVLTGMASFLNDYKQNTITTSDYVKALRQYARQHYLPNGEINLVENYDPNLGGPIVYYYWSNHYNHSTFNNLVISGLCGIRPSASDTLTLNPLVDTSIQYFWLGGVKYHGYDLTLVYDKDGSKYKTGKGLTVFVNGEKKRLIQEDGKYKIVFKESIVVIKPAEPVNHALNISRKGFPVPSASINATPDTSLYQAIDGRTWYFPEITNRWTSLGSTSSSDWFLLDFGEARTIGQVAVYPVDDGNTFAAPDSIAIEYKDKDGRWLQAVLLETTPARPTGNTKNVFVLDLVAATAIRLHFRHKGKQVAISEIECY